MGYGQGLSRFTEQKRVVADHDIGPLISTDMTRCSHCTRCVRFGEEVAGMPELGATGRGEDLKIGKKKDEAATDATPAADAPAEQKPDDPKPA